MTNEFAARYVQYTYANSRVTLAAYQQLVSSGYINRLDKRTRRVAQMLIDCGAIKSQEGVRDEERTHYD